MQSTLLIYACHSVFVNFHSKKKQKTKKPDLIDDHLAGKLRRIKFDKNE